MILTLALGARPAAGSPPQAGLSREQAVEAARAGRLDEAIAGLRELHRADPSDAGVTADLVVVLRWAERYEEALEASRSLVPGSSPAYALKAVGDSYLALQRPREAARVYRSISGFDPSVQIALFWAELEAEDFAAAYRTIDGLAAGAGEEGAGARRLAAMARAYGNQLLDAQTRLELLAAQRPDDAGLLLSLGTVYRWRGWPERALDQADRVLAGDPGNFDALASRTWALMDLGHLAEAGDLVERLAAERPGDSQIERLLRTAALRRRPEVRMEVGTGESVGAVSDTADRWSEVTVSGRLLGEVVRPFVRSTNEEVGLPEGRFEWNRLGIGAEVVAGRLHLTGEINAGRPGSGRFDGDPGFTAEMGWRLGDRWSVGTRFDSRSPSVPLRAHLHGIDGRAAQLSLRWQGSDLVGAGFSLGQVDFDDGNLRRTGMLWTDHRLLTRPHVRLNGIAELSGITNSLDDAPYFNPARGVTAAGTLVAEAVAWRRYERALSQRLRLTAGSSWQEGFDRALVGRARYEHDWQLSRTLSLRYGLTWSSLVYDGGRERRTSGFLASGWRF